MPTKEDESRILYEESNASESVEHATVNLLTCTFFLKISVELHLGLCVNLVYSTIAILNCRKAYIFQSSRERFSALRNLLSLVTDR
jgi:hypothetical protein